MKWKFPLMWRRAHVRLLDEALRRNNRQHSAELQALETRLTPQDGRERFEQLVEVSRRCMAFNVEQALARPDTRRISLLVAGEFLPVFVGHPMIFGMVVGRITSEAMDLIEPLPVAAEKKQATAGEAEPNQLNPRRESP